MQVHILPKQPHITKPTHTNTHTLQNPHIHTPTHYKTHTYKHPHITKPTHTHTHTLQKPQIHRHHKTHTYTNPHITKHTHTLTHTLQNPHIHTRKIYPGRNKTHNRGLQPKESTRARRHHSRNIPESLPYVPQNYYNNV